MEEINPTTPIGQPALERPSLLQNLLRNKPLLIGIATLIILSLVGLALVMKSNEITKSDNPIAKAPLMPTGEILFEPANTFLPPSFPASSDITINTGGNLVGGVVISIKYNPKVVRDVKLEQVKDPTSAISSALSQVGAIQHDSTTGTIFMTLTLPSGTSGLSGRGTVGKITFSKNNFNVAISSTTIEMQSNTNFITVKEGIIPVTKNYLLASFSK